MNYVLATSRRWNEVLVRRLEEKPQRLFISLPKRRAHTWSITENQSALCLFPTLVAHHSERDS